MGQKHTRRSVDGVVLVVTTVHPPDDPRIRYRTVGVLAETMPVRYATRPPGPSSTEDFQWVRLDGSRPVGALRALREMLRPDVSVISVHDPELIPLALVARMFGRRVVVDVHENVPAQVLHKEWLPAVLRRPIALMTRTVLLVAEQLCTVTIAEEGYGQLFRGRPVILVNFPIAEKLPPPQQSSDGGIVYVGDVTEVRGAEFAVRAIAGMSAIAGADKPPSLTMIGRCREPLRTRLLQLADNLDVELQLCGFMPHSEAMRAAAAADVGISPLLGLPNHRDSLPTKVIEYLAMGVPVIASDLPGTRRVVGGLPGVRLVPANDQTAWTTALQEFTTTDHFRSQAQQGVKEIRQRFTWPSDEVRRLYDGLRLR